jgi:methionyl-tRNA synthetase
MMLLVGTIEKCEEMPKSDKLLKLSVNFGQFGHRQILSGVKKYFTGAELIGKQAIFIYNLEPRQMMGLESQGMLLTAQNEFGNLYLIAPQAPVPNGTRLK